MPHVSSLKRWLILLIATISLATTVVATTTTTTATTTTTTATTTIKNSQGKAPGKLKIGLYVLRISDLNFINNSFKIKFWLFIHHKTNYDAISNLEIANALEENRAYQGRLINKDGTYTDYVKIQATIEHQFILQEYPFDHHALTLHFEDTEHMSDTLEYSIHIKNPKIYQILDSSVNLGKWTIPSINQTLSIHNYYTNFGETTRRHISPYSRYSLIINIKRIGLRNFIIMMILLYISAILALTTHFLSKKVGTASQRSSLLLGSIFSLSGNQIISQKFSAYSQNFTLLDKLQILTLIVILLSYYADITGYKRKKEHLYKTGYILALSYILSNIIFITMAHIAT